MKRSLAVFIQKMTGFQPYQSRPTGLHSKPVQQLVGVHYLRNKDVDDPSHTVSLKKVLIKVCPKCRRSMQVPFSQKHFFHTCCEGETMRMRGSLDDAIRKPRKIQRLLRQWDFDTGRPHNNPRRPRPKGRSN